MFVDLEGPGDALVGVVVFVAAEAADGEEAGLVEPGADAGDALGEGEVLVHVGVAAEEGLDRDDVGFFEELAGFERTDEGIQPFLVGVQAVASVGDFGHVAGVAGGGVVGAVVAEEGDTVGGTLVLEGEVDPGEGVGRCVGLVADEDGADGEGVELPALFADAFVHVFEDFGEFLEGDGVDDEVVVLSIDFEALAFAAEALDGGLAVDFFFEALGDAVGEGLETSVLGEPEDGLVGVAFGPKAHGGLDDVFDGGIGDAACDPGSVHLLEGTLPDLFVVGDHEVLCEAVAHLPKDPVAEVLGAGRSAFALLDGLEVAAQAVVASLGGQGADAVLEGVGDVAVVPEDAGLALGLDEGVPTDAVLHPIEDFLVLGEEDVAAGVVAGEAIHDGGAAEAARDFAFFEHADIVLVLVEKAGEGQTGDTGTENGDLQCGLQDSRAGFLFVKW